MIFNYVVCTVDLSLSLSFVLGLIFIHYDRQQYNLVYGSHSTEKNIKVYTTWVLDTRDKAVFGISSCYFIFDSSNAE